MASDVRVRFAPSPTGFLHVGGLHTALYNWLFARHMGGTFILRIEDTDQNRLVEGAIEQIAEALFDVGIEADEGVYWDENAALYRGDHGPYIQSARREQHKAYAAALVKMGKAYPCFCTKERLEEMAKKQQLAKQPIMYDRTCRDLPREEAEKRIAAGEEHVIRLAVPTDGKIVMEDLIRGKITVPWAQVDDQVLIKSDGFPTYHLAATCDDHDMEISHVIRGEEWISSLPKHLFLYDAFGWTRPQFAHLPLLLNADRSKLSKRQGDVAVKDYLDKGYVPEALINFIALLGWNPTSDREIFTKEELAKLFDITRVNKAGAVFNLEKLDWLNAQYLKAMSPEAYLAACRPWIKGKTDDAAFADRTCLLVRERVRVLSELPELTDFLFQPSLDVPPDILRWKTQPKEEARERLEALRTFVGGRDENGFTSVENLDQDVRKLITEKGWGNGDTLWPLRVALSGSKQSPGPFELLWAYGKERALQRIDEAIAKLV